MLWASEFKFGMVAYYDDLLCLLLKKWNPNQSKDWHGDQVACAQTKGPFRRGLHFWIFWEWTFFGPLGTPEYGMHPDPSCPPCPAHACPCPACPCPIQNCWNRRNQQNRKQGRHPANSCEKSWIFLNLLELIWIYLNSRFLINAWRTHGPNVEKQKNTGRKWKSFIPDHYFCFYFCWILSKPTDMAKNISVAKLRSVACKKVRICPPP